MVFKNNIPQPTDDLTVSQGDLLGNNSQLDTSFGIDHYTFSNLTVNNGKHNQVTTPLIIGAVHPTTIAAEPKMYAMQDSLNLGVLNYSRGPSDAIPTPLTSLQSPSTAITLAALTGTSNVLDFTGLARATATLYVGNYITPAVGLDFPNLNIAQIYWDGSTLRIQTQIANAIQAKVSGNILQITNPFLDPQSQVYWTLHLHRTK